MKMPLVILIAVLGLAAPWSSALSDETVVMACLRSGGETFTVKSFSSTAGAPAIIKNDSCAETLAILYALKFKIASAQSYTEGTQGGVLYTLIAGKVKVPDTVPQ